MESLSATRIALLGGFAVERRIDGVPTLVDDLPHNAQRLIAHLSLCGRPARASVAGQLWPDAPDGHAHGSLRSALWRVQKVVPGLLDVAGGALSLARDVCVDVRDFRDWAQRALDPDAVLDAVTAPDPTLREELLPGWYDDWVLLERERLRQLQLHALEALANRLAGAGRFGEAAQAAYTAVHTEPLRESAHRAVVRVHLAEGNIVEALRAYGAFRDMLARELGVAPTRQMEELMSAVRRPVRLPERVVPSPDRAHGGRVEVGPRSGA